MCGRVNMSVDPAGLVGEFDIDHRRCDIAPRYNVPPGAVLPIVLERADAGGALSRRLEAARWGLVPDWADGARSPFNARAETVDVKPMFRSAFVRRRCAVAVNGYYEWQATAEGKQPWYMHPAEGQWLFIAGLFELSRGAQPDDPAVTEGWLVSTTMLTVPAAGHLSDVHDRMPLFLDAEGVREWMHPQAQTKDAASALLAHARSALDPERVVRHRVGRAVGNVRNDGPELTEPLD